MAFIDMVGSLLLFSLAIPVVMKYRILPVEGTPYWLFGVLFLILIANVITSLKKFPEIYKNIFLIATLVIVLGGVTTTAMVDRNKTAPVFGVHDIILQQEAAIRYLVNGKNPYKETYFDTPVADFNYDEPGNTEAINPALYHFVMPPWYLLFPLPIYYVAIHTLGFFDGRMVSLITMALLLLAIWYWFKNKNLARIAITLTAFSPGVVDYFIEGRSDIFALSFFITALVFMDKKYSFWSAVAFGLALASKQTIWFAIPFIFIKTSIKYVLISCSVFFMLALGFLIWDYRAFFDSVVFYLSGNTPNSYPVQGYGWSMVLYEFGFIKNIHAYYPFIFWQALFSIPVFFVLKKWSKTSQSALLISYSLFLFIIWYFSRYFNNSHIGFIAILLVLGGLKHEDA